MDRTSDLLGIALIAVVALIAIVTVVIAAGRLVKGRLPGSR